MASSLNENVRSRGDAAPGSPRPSALRVWSGRVVLMSIALLMTVVCAEILLRVLHLHPRGALFTVSQKEYDRIPGIYAPNQQTVLREGSALEYEIRIDSLGYRGTHFPRRKLAGTARVVFTGDSFTWGEFVDDDETLPAQLEHRLKSTCASAHVINAGASGATIYGEAEMILRSIELEPDAAILMFFENDVPDLINTRMWEQLAQNRHAKSRFPLSVVYPLMRKTVLWNLALNATRNQRVRAGIAAMDGDEAAQNSGAARVEYERRLLALRDSLHRYNVPLLLVLFPSHESVEGPTVNADQEWVSSMATSHGVPVLDLLQPFRDSGLAIADLYLLPYDPHGSPQAYALASDHVHVFLQGHLPSPCGTAREPAKAD